MCFSATSSFTAAASLIGIGAATVIRSTLKRSYMLASVPLLFGLQQAAEGIVWVTVNNSSQMLMHFVAAYVFLFFALILWPIWIPASLYALETKPTRKKIMLSVIIIGLLFAILASYVLLTQKMSILVLADSIRYHIIISPYFIQHSDLIGSIAMTFYIIPTAAAFFFYDNKHAWMIGAGLLVALIATYYFTAESLVSVWCYFAALISILIFVTLPSLEDGYTTKA